MGIFLWIVVIWIGFGFLVDLYILYKGGMLGKSVNLPFYAGVWDTLRDEMPILFLFLVYGFYGLFKIKDVLYWKEDKYKINLRD